MPSWCASSTTCRAARSPSARSPTAPDRDLAGLGRDLGRDLGPLAPHVPASLRGTAAYHVPQPPRTVAKLDANELPYGLPDDLRAELGRALAEVALERYPDAAARG